MLYSWAILLQLSSVTAVCNGTQVAFVPEAGPDEGTVEFWAVQFEG